MQQRSEETRASILSAAVEQFSGNGYEATSVSQVCRAAGVSKGAFYHHFPSKQAVFLELLEGWLALLDEQFKLVRSQSSDVPGALLTMTSMIGEIYRTAGGSLPMFLEFWNQAHHEPDIWSAVIAPYNRYQDYFASMIQEGIDEGSLRQVDPESTARVLVALAVGLLLQGVLDPDGADWQQVSQAGFQMVLNDIIKQVES